MASTWLLLVPRQRLSSLLIFFYSNFVWNCFNTNPQSIWVSPPLISTEKKWRTFCVIYICMYIIRVDSWSGNWIPIWQNTDQDSRHCLLCVSCQNIPIWSSTRKMLIMLKYLLLLTLWVTFDKDALALKVLEIYICSVPFVKIYLLEKENQKKQPERKVMTLR